jgi:hypothetical protein
VSRWIEVKPDNIGQQGGKARITRTLEGADAVRLQLVRLPDALHRAQQDADRPGHRPVQWAAWCGGMVQVSATTRAVVCAAIGVLPGLRVLSRSRRSTPISA